jgi:glucose-6-phosphate 1-dehydrogenase
VLRIDPDPGMRLQLTALADSQRWRPVMLDTAFAPTLGPPINAYQRVLYAALTGDDRLFARQDAIDQSWRIIEPLLAYPRPLRHYAAGSWGRPRPTPSRPTNPPGCRADHRTRGGEHGRQGL